jgi:hypothetical protein
MAPTAGGVDEGELQVSERRDDREQAHGGTSLLTDRRGHGDGVWRSRGWVPSIGSLDVAEVSPVPSGWIVAIVG